MRLYSTTLALLALLTLPAALAAQPAPRTLVLTNVHVIDGTGAAPQRNVQVVSTGTRLVHIGPGPVRVTAPADTICRESPRAWHRAAGDTLWLYILMDRATQRVDTQAVVIAGDSAIQLRPRPRRLGPTQATRMRAMRDRCAARDTLAAR